MSGLCEKLGDNSLFFTIISFAVCNCFTDAKTDDIAETTPVTGAVEVPKINVKVSMPGREEQDRKSTRLNSSHPSRSRMPSSA